MEKNNNVNVLIRMDKNKVKELKKIAQQKSHEEHLNISYNDLIVLATYKKFFNDEA